LSNKWGGQAAKLSFPRFDDQEGGHDGGDPQREQQDLFEFHMSQSSTIDRSGIITSRVPRVNRRFIALPK
jgi:hypothetical protein